MPSTKNKANSGAAQSATSSPVTKAGNAATLAKVVAASASKRKGSGGSKKGAASAKAPFVHDATLFEGHKKSVYAVAFDPYTVGANFFFCTAGSNKASVYECSPTGTSFKLQRIFEDPDSSEFFYAVTWAQLESKKTGSLIVVGGLRGVIRVVSPEDAKMITNLQGHGDAINELRTCPEDSTIVASASKDLTVRLWHIRHSQCLAILGGVGGHRDQVLSLDFWGDQFLASGSMDHAVMLWDIGHQDVKKRIDDACDSRGGELNGSAAQLHYPVANSRDLHTNYVDCVRVVGSFVFSKSSENFIQVWKFGSFDEAVAGRGTTLKPETLVSHYAKLSLPGGATWFIKFDLHPQNKFFACGNDRGDIHVWDLRKGCVNNTHSDYILPAKDSASCLRHVTFSPDGRTMIAVGEQGRVSRYNLVEGNTANPK